MNRKEKTCTDAWRLGVQASQEKNESLKTLRGRLAMQKNSTGTATRQSVPLFGMPSEQDFLVVAVGVPQNPVSDGPRLVTRGRLLQSPSLPPSAITQGVLIDWLSFTLPVPSVDSMSGCVYELRQLFGDGEYQNKGYSGYTNSIVILGGKGKILWNERRVEMGVHVDLPSSALRNMEQDGILSDVADLLGWLLHREAKISRLDVAIDTDTVTIDRVAAAVDGDELVSRCRSAREIKMLRGEPGRTVYIGATSSNRMVRFYDKAAEQGLEGVVWTRCEVQHRRKHAQVAAQAIVDGVFDPVALFNSVCDFRDPDSDINPTRRTRCDWWVNWLGSVSEKVSFAFALPDKAVKQVADWIIRQVSTSLAMLAVADPENIKNWLLAVVDDGFVKLDPYKRQKAVKFRDMGYALV